jgi:hypothetical protein
VTLRIRVGQKLWNWQTCFNRSPIFKLVYSVMSYMYICIISGVLICLGQDRYQLGGGEGFYRLLGNSCSSLVRNFPLVSRLLCLYTLSLASTLVTTWSPNISPPAGLYSIFLQTFSFLIFLHVGPPLLPIHLNNLYHCIDTILFFNWRFLFFWSVTPCSAVDMG